MSIGTCMTSITNISMGQTIPRASPIRTGTATNVYGIHIRIIQICITATTTPKPTEPYAATRVWGTNRDNPTAAINDTNRPTTMIAPVGKS